MPMVDIVVILGEITAIELKMDVQMNDHTYCKQRNSWLNEDVGNNLTSDWINREDDRNDPEQAFDEVEGEGIDSKDAFDTHVLEYNQEIDLLKVLGRVKKENDETDDEPGVSVLREDTKNESERAFDKVEDDMERADLVLVFRGSSENEQEAGCGEALQWVKKEDEDMPCDSVFHEFEKEQNQEKTYTVNVCGKGYSLCHSDAMPERRREAYDANFKLQVVKYAEECKNNRLTAREFDICEKQVRDWRKAASALSALPRTKKACRGTKTPFFREEQELKEWVTSLRQTGYIVTREAIRLKAKELIQHPSFLASAGWCTRFINRNNLKIKQKTKISQKLQGKSLHQTKKEDEDTCCESVFYKVKKEQNQEVSSIPEEIMKSEETREARETQSNAKTENQNEVPAELDGRHSRKQHLTTNSKDRLFTCNVCGKGFGVKSRLTVHVRKHSGERPYTCDICGKGFAVKGKLTVHMKIHSGERHYICDRCGKGFFSRKNLTNHMKIHSGERPYTCEICGKGFTMKGQLTVHIRIHSRDRTYTCDICGKICTLKSNLAKHMRIHSDERPYTVNVCGRGYSLSHSDMTPERKREAYDANFKLQVAKYAEDCKNNRLTAREFDISEKLVRNWRKAAPVLSALPGTKKACRGTKTPFLREEQELKEWVISLRQRGYIVTQAAIRSKAKELIQHPSFQASAGWCARFISRNNLKIQQKTKISQKLSADLEDKIALFQHWTGDCEMLSDDLDDAGLYDDTMTKDSGESTYTCDICGKDFTLKSNLAKHMRIHSEERPYTVDGCGIGYSLCHSDTMPAQRREAYDANFKLQVVKYAEECKNNRLTAREFHISEKQVRNWRKAAPVLSALPGTKKACRGMKTPFLREEQELKEWVTSLRQSGCIVTRTAIRSKAKELIQNPSFQASAGWCTRFMRRYNLTVQRKRISQKLPADDCEMLSDDSDEMYDDVMTDEQFVKIFNEDSDTEFDGF